jgi:uncharacterized protein YrzB (UPF0473 family)
MDSNLYDDKDKKKDDACNCSDESCGCSDDACNCSDEACKCTDESCGCSDDACGCSDDACECGHDHGHEGHDHGHEHATIVMTDTETGKEYTFQVEDMFDYEGEVYYVLVTEDSEEPELVITKVVAMEDGTEGLVSLEPEESEKVYAEYDRLCDEAEDEEGDEEDDEDGDADSKT